MSGKREVDHRKTYAEDDGPIYPWREPLPEGKWQLWEIVVVILMLIGLCLMGGAPMWLAIYGFF